MSAALHPRHPRSLVESKSITHIQKAVSSADKIKFKTIPSFLIRGAKRPSSSDTEAARQVCVSLPSSSNLCVKCSLNEGAAEPAERRILEQMDGTFPIYRRHSYLTLHEANSAEMSSKLAKLGVVAVLAYGLFDGVAYTSFFILAFLGYEKSMGKNPAASLQALLGWLSKVRRYK